jgi:ankyrin repeat protein
MFFKNNYVRIAYINKNIQATDLKKIMINTNKKFNSHAINSYYPIHPFVKETANPDISLGTASEDGDIEMVKFYVSIGADVQYNNNYALKWACRNGHLDIVKFLISKGADIYSDNSISFQWAITGNHLEIADYLADVDIDRNEYLCITDKKE